MKRIVLCSTLLGWLAAMGPAAWAQGNDSLEPNEQEAMTETLQYALEYGPTNQSAEWVNPDTTRSGSVVPVRTFETSQGPCREFITSIIVGGNEEQGYGTACRQPDGSWQLVSDDAFPDPAPPAPTREQVYVYEAPKRYYVYPAGFYGPQRIFLSFSYVNRSGRSYWGKRYLDGPAFYRRYPRYPRHRHWVGPKIYRYYRTTPPRSLGHGDRRPHVRQWSNPDRRGRGRGRGHR